MKKHRFKLKPVHPPAPRPAPAPAAETPRPAAPEPLRPPAPELEAAFAEAVETLRRNLHCDRPAARNQAAFLLYKIYCQEVRLPALEQSLLAIESNLGLTVRSRSLASRLTQIERATARLREAEVAHTPAPPHASPPEAPPAPRPEAAPAIAPEAAGCAPDEATDADGSRRDEERGRPDASWEERWTASNARVDRGTRLRTPNTS